MIASLDYSWIWTFIGFVLICLSIFIILRWLKDNPNDDNKKDIEDINKDVDHKKDIEDINKDVDHIEDINKDVDHKKDIEDIKEDICIKEDVNEADFDMNTIQEVEFVINKPTYEDIDISTCKGRSKGEKICCKTMEYMFNLPFNSVRPSFLKNPETGRNLEIDCYNEDLKIAVEYNGIQHYKWPNFTGQSKEDFIRQLERDKMKKEVCKRKGILLINVPYTIKHQDIPTYLHDTIKKYYRKKNNF